MKWKSLLPITFLIVSSFSWAAADIYDGPSEFDVIIIGAGAGGLSSGAILAQKGLKVAVFEQYDKVGGFMTAFERDGYAFEVPLHAVDSMGKETSLYDIFQELHLLDQVEFTRLDPLYRTIFPDQTIDVPADWQAYRDMLMGKFPHEKKGIKKFFSAMKALNDEVVAFQHLSSKHVFVRRFSSLFSSTKFRYIRNYSKKDSFKDIVDDHVKDEKLQAILGTLSGYIGVPSSRSAGLYQAVMWARHHFRGGYYLKASSQALANTMAEVIRQNNGRIFLNCPVERILVDKNKAIGIRTASGKQYRSSFVISNAGAETTYLKLIGRDSFNSTFIRSLEGKKIACSAFCVFLAFDTHLEDVDYKYLHEIFYHPSYSNRELAFPSWAGSVSDPPFGLVMALNREPGFAPEGKTVLSVLILLPYKNQNARQLTDRDKDYVKIEEKVAWNLIHKAETILPVIKDHLEVIEIGAPRSMAGDNLPEKGAIYGVTMTPKQSQLFQLNPKDPVQNLYLAGTWSMPGDGQSDAIMSGYRAARRVLDHR